MNLNLIAIKTSNPEALKKQYECLGLAFAAHQHGKGPVHFAAEMDRLVFEIYPLPRSVEKADDTLRLGFEIEALDERMPELENNQWRILSPPQNTEWGYVAIVQDLDGRKIELTEKTSILDERENS